ncbi:MAG: hypothetical protein AB7R90_05010 [Reyranellaceae bacterium]
MPRPGLAVLLALLALLGLSLAATAARAQGGYHSPALGVTFPATMGGLRFVRTTDFEQRQRGLGVGVYYNNPSPFVAVDVFIYDKGGRVPSGYEPAAIQDEARQAVADIHSVAASGLYANVKVFQGPTPCRAGGGVFQCATLEYVRTPQGQPAVPTRSLLLLRGAKGNFVKVRLSWPQAQDVQAEPVVERWLTELVRLLPTT